MLWSRIPFSRLQALPRRKREQPFGSPARLLASTSGSTAVEFAFIAPIFITTLLFILSIGYITFLGQMLDSTTQMAARKIRTGAIQAAGYTQDDFRTKVVCPSLGTMFTCANVIVNVQGVPSNAANHPNEHYGMVKADQSGLIVPTLSNTATKYCPGAQKTYVYVQILYPASIFLSMFTTMGVTTTYNGTQVYLLMATATFLNEPFGNGGTTC